MQKLLYILLLPVLLLTVVSSCKKEKLDTDPSSKLEFSTDTVYFDTVFVTLGSITHNFKVYNRSKSPIKVSRIYLAGGSQSLFRLNIDGEPSQDVRDVEIPANDSIFIFAEVTINPNDENNPFLVSDSVMFETNGNQQQVKLIAYGRNAVFYRPQVKPQNGFPPYSILPCGTVWTNEKPIVIIGYLAVDTCSLIIEKGTQVYLYNNSGIWVYPGGNIKVNGTLEDTVVFQGVRKEAEYQNIAGQWDRIWINQGTGENVIEYALIKNGNIGLQTEYVPQFTSNPDGRLKVSNTRIRNMKGMGVYSVAFNIEAANTVISNCGSYAMALIGGGNYQFTHCTVANYWGSTVRREPSVYLSNAKANPDQSISLGNFNFAFRNSILYGNMQGDNELEIYGHPDAEFNWKFSNSLIKLKNEEIDGNDPAHFEFSILNQDPLFVSNSDQDYRLQAGSPAINSGSPAFIGSFILDILGRARNADSAPDMGAYEYQP